MFGKPMLMMILMMMMMTIIMIIIMTIIFVFLWLVVGYLLPTCLLTIMAWGHDLCDSCLFGAIAIVLQWVNCHRDRACQGTRSAGLLPCLSESSFGSVYSHMGRDPRDS